MTNLEAINKIKKIRPTCKKSLIEIKSINTWLVDNYYIVIKFLYHGKLHEYREDASEAWIETELKKEG